MYQTITEQVAKLTSQEQEKLFEILFSNIELFEKIMPDSLLIAHAKGQLLLDHPIEIAFDAWKAKR
jgi:hypothetical protein